MKHMEEMKIAGLAMALCIVMLGIYIVVPKDGTVSRIVPHLSQGAGVVTTRGDVHYVVTEFGVAYLHGKSVQERAIALISIAHPASVRSCLKVLSK